MGWGWRSALVAVVAAALGGCGSIGTTGPAGSHDTGVPADPAFARLAGWRDDDQAQALAAFRASCGRLLRQPANYSLGPEGIAGRAADWWGPCRAAGEVEPAPAAARRFFEKWFMPVPLGGGEPGLFTGYYEPELRGSWKRTARFDVPLYRLPPRMRRMPTRGQIQNGALAGRGLELLWVDDAVDAFFLEIQGSGRVRLPDGTVVGVEYAGQNGHPYFPVGRTLVQWGEMDLESVSMPAIREWMRRNPARIRELKATNRSQIFFRLREIAGARGAIGVALTPGRSLAVDPRHVPMGAPLWLDLVEAPTPDRTLRRLVVAQDTGGAIKGGVRGDLFWGAGEAAAAAAGHMRASGRAWMLVPRQRTVGIEAAR